MLSEHVDFTRLVELAREGVGQAYRLPTADLARLSACTFSVDSAQVDVGQNESGEAELAADVRFDIGTDGFPRVGLSITGQLSLQCQRCLGPMMWPVRIRTRLSVLETEEQTTLLESPLDSVVMSADGLDLVDVIEDEILAALPMAPVHRDDPTCRQASEDDSNSEIEAELMQKPFAELANLVASRKSEADD